MRTSKQCSLAPWKSTGTWYRHMAACARPVWCSSRPCSRSRRFATVDAPTIAGSKVCGTTAGRAPKVQAASSLASTRIPAATSQNGAWAIDGHQRRLGRDEAVPGENPFPAQFAPQKANLEPHALQLLNQIATVDSVCQYIPGNRV